MKHAQIIKHYGSPTKAAAYLIVTLQTLRNWKKKGIPKRSQERIEAWTTGALKADRK